jgi:ABC-2 type transport system permease protein
LPIAIAFAPEPREAAMPGSLQYYGAALLFMAARLVAFIMEDRASGVAVRLVAAPITTIRYLGESLLAYALLLTAQNGVFVAIHAVQFGYGIRAALPLFILYVCFSAEGIGFALAWYSLFRNKEAAFTVLFGVIMLMLLTGGLIIPVDVMPAMLQRVAMLLPTYWLADGLRLALAGASAADVAIPAAALLLYAAVFLLAGSKRRMG